MSLLLLLLSLPLLYWPHGVETAPTVKGAGIERLAVPLDRAEAWQKAGFSVVPMSEAELAAREKLTTPRIAARAEVASPTRSPFIYANGWRFLRAHGQGKAGKYYYDLPAGKAALAAAEAFAYGADAVLKIDPADLAELGAMLAFLRRLPADEWPGVADIAVVDDGSALAGEVLNLLARRNLLFRAVPSPSPQFRINVKLGSPEYPEAEAADPSAFALKVRRQLTDGRRSLRVYGSEVVICRMTGGDGRVRLHLLNYGGRGIDGLRLRLRGAYGKGEAKAFGYEGTALTEVVVAAGATEFTLPQLGSYALIELR